MLSDKLFLCFDKNKAFSQFIKKEAPDRFKELKTQRLKLVTQFLDHDLPQEQYTQKSTPNQTFIPFIHERDGLGRVIGKKKLSFNKDESINTVFKKKKTCTDQTLARSRIESQTITFDSKERWLMSPNLVKRNKEEINESIHMNTQDNQQELNKSIIKKGNLTRLSKQLTSNSPMVGYYNIDNLQEYVNFPKTKNVIFSRKIFDSEEHSKKQKEIKDTLRRQKSQDFQLLLKQQNERENIKKNLLRNSQSISSLLSLPKIIDSQPYVQEILRSNRQLRINLKPLEDFPGFPKEFEKNLIDQKRKLRELRNKLKEWGEIPEDEKNKNKSKVRPILLDM